jgi:hypothetical protein
MGKAMGADFSGVKVHTDSQSDKLNRSLSSRAFATGPNLFFKQGEYNPGSRSGQELIAHELTHVVQQGSTPTYQKKTDSPTKIQAESDQKIQRAVVEMVASDWMVGNAHLYDSHKNPVAEIQKGAKLRVDMELVENFEKQKGKLKDLVPILTVVDMDKLVVPKGKYIEDIMSDLWIDPARLKQIGIQGKKDNSLTEKIKRVVEILKPYAGIHTNYKKYQKQINSKPLGILLGIQNAVNTILGKISKFDPSGITGVIATASSLVKTVTQLGVEYAALADDRTRQEVTPLLAEPDGQRLTIKIADLVEQLKEAWKGVEEDPEAAEEQVIEL